MHDSNQGQQAHGAHSEAEKTVTDPALKAKQERIFNRALLWLGIGVFIMVISFGINFILFHSSVNFHIPMYVMTISGIICISKGFWDIFG